MPGTVQSLTSVFLMKKSKAYTRQENMRVALVVPHIFMHRDILPEVIFSPGHLALQLAGELQRQGVSITLFTPGPVETDVPNITTDLSLFERELAGRDDTYMDLLRKHPFTFITLARQVQSELIAKAYRMANSGRFDLVHVYTNEEEIGMAFASLCEKPVVFTHHDPFNFLVKYKNNLPKYKHLNWISMSYAQREGMPPDTNWIGNIYHGMSDPAFKPADTPSRDYFAYMGRIIEPKGVHLAIQALKRYNKTAEKPLPLRIVGKHYAEESKDRYWQEKIVPHIDGKEIIYDGFINTSDEKAKFLANAKALLVPSLFDEPFGMVSIEAFACDTPVVALNSGALPELIDDGVTGFVVEKQYKWNGKLDEIATTGKLTHALNTLKTIDHNQCRKMYESCFTLGRMAEEHMRVYAKIIQ